MQTAASEVSIRKGSAMLRNFCQPCCRCSCTSEKAAGNADWRKRSPHILFTSQFDNLDLECNL